MSSEQNIYQTNKNTAERGFTLIELLAVIAIIGILSSAIFAFTLSARRSASDANEIRAIQEVTKALELYYQDYNTYDTLPLAPNCNSERCVDCSESDPSNFFNELQNKGYFTQQQIMYMFGESPSNPNKKACYIYSPDGQKYKFMAILYNSEKMQKDGGLSNNRYETGNDLSFTNWGLTSSYDDLFE